MYLIWKLRASHHQHENANKTLGRREEKKIDQKIIQHPNSSTQFAASFTWKTKKKKNNNKNQK